MSNFSELLKISGQKAVKLPEKSNFSQTCSMLSQYLKQKGSFGDLSLGITCNLEEKGNSTMNLLPTSNTKMKSMDLFPQDAGFGHTLTMKDIPIKKSEFREIVPEVVKETDGTQMTIFYAGKVLVFDKFPENKAKEIMQFATTLTLSAKEINSNGNSSSSASTNANGNEKLSSGGLHSSLTSSNFSPVSGINNSTQEITIKAKVISGLPIARKASLHRFLEKRKDRINAKAPYQVVVNNSSTEEAVVPTKQPNESSKTWLGLAASPPYQLQL